MSIVLRGCSAEPLGSYLKGLAVLRLISEQVDKDAALWWDGLCFQLSSSLDEEGLVEFFLNQYRPTPIIAPWNCNSGFYTKDRKVGIRAIATSKTERFEEYRRAIKIASSIPEVVHARNACDMKGISKTEEDERRAAVLRRAATSCRTRQWIGWMPQSGCRLMGSAHLHLFSARVVMRAISITRIISWRRYRTY